MKSQVNNSQTVMTTFIGNQTVQDKRDQQDRLEKEKNNWEDQRKREI